MTTADVTAEAIEAALAELGTTAKQVAKKLLAEGCKGRRRQCGQCPVAQYLRKTFPGKRIDVGAGMAHVGDAGGVIPEPVARFIWEFDDSQWPLPLKAVYEDLVVG